ncbi:aspartic peptidase domain-containing protein [Gongronella butleri]|nr:aspartic peptidase domain-containing protein [Gongronella butleri]
MIHRILTIPLCASLLAMLVTAQDAPHVVRIKRTSPGVEQISAFATRRASRLNSLATNLLSEDDPQEATDSTLTFGARNFIWSYLIEVGVGTNSDGEHQNFNLVLDSGSPVVWVPGTKCTEETCHMEKSTRLFDTEESTSFELDKRNHLKVSYGSGYCDGLAGTDTLYIGDLKVENQHLGVAEEVSKDLLTGGVNGIFGIGPSQSTRMFNKKKQLWKTPLEMLVSNKKLSSNIFSVYFDGIDNPEDMESNNGQLTIGSLPARSTYTGELKWVPRHQEGIFAYYWGVVAKGFKIGDKKYLKTGAGIVDTGTTMIIVTPEFSKRAIESIRGVRLDENKLLVTKCKSVDELPTFTFLVGDAEFPLKPRQYTVPEWQATYWKVSDGDCPLYISVENIGDFNFVLGQKFLEHYVSVYDNDKQRIGFAPSVHAQ